jgi:hypothetical protein
LKVDEVDRFFVRPFPDGGKVIAKREPNLPDRGIADDFVQFIWISDLV